jgi:ketosteroid isomerase-like protein
VTGDAIVSVIRRQLRAHSGVELETVDAWLTSFRDGKISQIEQHGTEQEALDAVDPRH